MKLSKTDQLNLFLVVLLLLVIGFENYNLKQDRNEWIKIANDAVAVMKDQGKILDSLHRRFKNECFRIVF